MKQQASRKSQKTKKENFFVGKERKYFFNMRREEFFK